MPQRTVPEPSPGDDDPNPRTGQTGWCNGCDGRGTRADSDTYYPFSVENVQEFVAFLKDCGGFEIW